MSWEQYAPTSESQLARLSRLKTACGGEEAEAIVRRNQQQQQERAPATIPTLGDSAKPSGIAALYKDSYYGGRGGSDTAAAGGGGGGVGGGDELGGSARRRGAELREYARTCQAFVADIERAVHLLDTIAQQQEQVTSKTQALHATCESLLSEQHTLEAQVKALSAPLQRFGALRELGPALGLPFASQSSAGGAGGEDGAPRRASVGVGAGGDGARWGGGTGLVRRASSGGGGGGPGGGRVLLHPGSDEFAEALARAASAMAYLRRHPEFIEGPQYVDKYVQLLSRALALVKNQVMEYLEQAARLSGEKPVVEGRLETSEIYSRFRSVSHRVNAGVALMRKYVSAAPLVKTLLSDFRQLYFEKRLALLRPAVRSHLEAMSKQRGITAMIRFGAAFLVRVGQLETQLYDACLGPEEEQEQAQNQQQRETAAASSSSNGTDETKGSSSPRGEEGKGGRGNQQEEEGGGEEEGQGEEEEAKRELDLQREEEAAEVEEGRAGLYGMLLQLCSELHKHLRPRVYHGTDMDTLCELVSVIREEIVEEQRGRHGLSQINPVATAAAGAGAGHEGGGGGGGEAAIETILMKLVQDSQERLIYMATKVIQDDIASFRPTPEDLDYPGMLLRAAKGGGTGDSLVNARTGPGDQPSPSSPPSSGKGSAPAYTTWYPPLRSTLQVLSKVYRAVDMGVFEDLAQLSVAACAESLKKAAVSISAGVTAGSAPSPPVSSGGGGRGAPGGALAGGSVVPRAGAAAAPPAGSGEGGLDAQLFLIKHLLTLREQLTPFHIQFVHAEQKLNFGSTRMALRKFIRHTPALFRLSSKNALVELTVDSIPTIDEVQARAFEDTSREDVDGAGLESLRAQPFANPDRVKDAFHAAVFSATAALPRVCAAMSLYLDNKATEGILLHPVQRRVVDAVDGVRDVLQRLHPAEDLEEIMPLLTRVSQLALSAGEDGGNAPPSPAQGK
ncbi:conserved unknown protein [Ectocarpus siliculosus]|uniref:Conserved oligomeric Golgi complex subunit 3 n=1 Tax=Ectocarpus siliculosus TaxID=2880 RepID=D7G064_ECTSI|nr:conserved unknown protein [Ectocarpus siliculosus]|eukprot:CBJ32946.1 conserved unknown protein [Ectocarpus siliculosus]